MNSYQCKFIQVKQNILIDLMHNDVILWSQRLKSFENGTLERFENLIWLKITIRTNKLEYLLYN